MGSERWIISKGEAADFFNVSFKTIDDWIRRGAPVKSDGGRGRRYELDLRELVDWRMGRLGCNGDSERLDLGQETAKLKRAQMEKTAMELAALRGELVPLKAVKAFWGLLISNARARILAAPPKIARGDERVESRAIRILRSALSELDRDGVPPSDRLDGRNGAVEAAADADDQPVGRKRKDAQRRGKRRAGKVGK